MELSSARGMVNAHSKTTMKTEKTSPFLRDPKYTAQPPSDEIEFSELCDLAGARRNLLWQLEKDAAEAIKYQRLMVSSKIGVPTAEGRKAFKNLADCGISFNLTNEKEFRKDVISHHILRLAFSGDEEKRKWFINQECQLLRLRIETITLTEFLRCTKNEHESYLVTDEEFAKHKKTLQSYRPFVPEKELQLETHHKYYKIPFEEGLSLLEQRTAYLLGGNLYVYADDFAPVLVNQLRDHLNEQMNLCAKQLPMVKEDDRMSALLEALIKPPEAEYKFDKHTGKISLADIDPLAKRSFPLCMRNLHAKLRTNHHLKHNGRLQLGLFIKGIGLSLDDSLEFWRNEFTRMMSSDKFEKEYAYNIRHNYGKEGKKADYTPYSCTKIIHSAPGSGEYHGCPFRHFDQDHLTTSLKSYGVGDKDVFEVIQLVKDHHYQIACRKYFEITHPNNPRKNEVVINHPNQYFDRSMQYYEEKEKEKEKTSPSKSKADSNSAKK